MGNRRILTKSRLRGYSPKTPFLIQARFDELSNQTGPTGLMRRTDTAPVIAVKIFEELYVIAEMRVGL
jgi:hypothetical protein